jgi:hypothetical protein
MALKVFDGFDHYNSKTDLTARSGVMQWQWMTPGAPGSGTPTGTVNFVPFPGGSVDGECVFLQGQSWYDMALLTAVLSFRNQTNIVGFRQYAPSGPVVTASGFAIFFYDTQQVGGPAIQFTILFNENSYGINVFNGSYSAAGSTQIGISANNVWAANTGNMIEVQYTISTTVGAVKIIVNGVTVLNLTNVNTQTGSNAVADGIGFKPEINGGITQATGYFDDFYVCDTTLGPGTYPCNSPLGDVHVYTRFPTGNNSAQWTPLANTNWQEVSEVVMDGDTSYNYSSTVTQEDLLNFSALSTTINNILGVQVTGAYRKDDSSARSIKQAFKSGATKVYGTVDSLPTAYTYFTDLWVLDPNTSASWLLAAVNALSAGYNLVS